MLGQRADSAHAAPVFRYPVRAPERRLPVASHVRQETDAKEPASPPEVSDEALMAAYCAGDEAAFRRLFQRYGGRIYSFLLHTTGERTQAEDLSQQTWLKLHRARGSFDGGSRFAAWLYTIAANLRRDEARVRRRRPEDLTADGQVPSFAASAEPEVSAEAEAVRRALEEILT